MNLFGEFEENKSSGGIQRNGPGGQWLTLADLKFRGLDAFLLEGPDTDLVVDFEGKFKRLEVKASNNNCFGPGGDWRTGGSQRRRLCDYKVDGFAFVNPPRRAVYYVHHAAIIGRSYVMRSNQWGRQSCDASFDEMLKRWRLLG